MMAQTDARVPSSISYAQKYSWIRTWHRRIAAIAPTGAVWKPFSMPTVVQSRDWEYLVNLDGDLTFAPDYFGRCFEYFHKTPQLGIAGGAIYAKWESAFN